jgi:hypothetical protein
MFFFNVKALKIKNSALASSRVFQFFVRFSNLNSDTCNTKNTKYFSFCKGDEVFVFWWRNNCKL